MKKDGFIPSISAKLGSRNFYQKFFQIILNFKGWYQIKNKSNYLSTVRKKTLRKYTVIETDLN
jgi:hypothetical protein